MGIGSRSGVTGTSGGPAAAVDITAVGGVPVTSPLPVDVEQWGGVDVAAASVPTDAMANTAALAYVGARSELINPLGQWDMAASGFFSPTSTFTGFANSLPFMQYNAAPLVLADGAAVVLQSDVNGNLKVAITGTVAVGTVDQGVGAGPAAPWSVELTDGAAFYTAAKTGQFPAALVGGRLDVNVGAWLGSTAPTVGQKLMGSSVPVVIASDQSAVPVSGTVTATPSVVGGGTEAAAQRVTIANDSTGLLSVDDNGGSLTVDNATLSTVGGGTEAAAMRVTIANDSTGLLSVDDNGGSLTVDGTVAVSGTVTTTVAAPSLFTNFGTDPDVSVKGSAGVVLSLSVHNLNGAARYAQLHNKASAPATNDVPLLTFLVPTGAMIVLGTDFFTQAGIAFGTGIAFGFSTTEATYTAGAAGDQFTQITYI